MKLNTVSVNAVLVICFLLSGYNLGFAKAPPTAREDNVIDEYYGVKVDDPYRYMENIDDPEVQTWIRGQADYTSSTLDKIPGRSDILSRLVELDAGKPYRIFGITKLKNGTMFFQKRAQGENLPKLYVRLANSKDDQLLIDPENIKSADKQHYSIGSYTPSPDGKYVVYGLAKGGSEETVLHIIETESGKKLLETIDNIETAYNRPKWLPDGSGFFYCRRQELAEGAPETDIYKNSAVFFHKLGDEVENDERIVGTPHSKMDELTDVDFPSLSIPTNSDYAVMKIKHGDSKELTIYTAPVSTLLTRNIPWVMVCSVKDEVVEYAVHDSDIYLRTAKGAPKYKVVRTSLEKPDFSSATTVLNIGHQVIEYLSAAKDALYIGMNDGGFNRIARIEYGRDAIPRQLELPDNCSGNVYYSSLHHSGILVSTNSWTKGSLVYQYHADTDEFTDSGLMPKGKYDDVSGFSSAEVRVKSHDGVMVPLSLIYKSDIVLDGSNPTLIRGYGAYGNSMGVYFNPLNLAWLEIGGVLAVAHVRGGGEYGKEWHQAGQMLTKPNTWKDFIACAEYLVETGYTSKELLAGQGGSAGGILIGRAITERPDLFAAAIISVGCLDAVRMETTTNGVPNIQEFGTFTNEDGFRGLYEMSSYHHVKDGEAYPAVMLTHGINDPRVEPWMSAKMTARLQKATSSGNPILFRVEYGAGHGIGSTQTQRLAERADRLAFLIWQFGLKYNSVQLTP